MGSEMCIRDRPGRCSIGLRRSNEGPKVGGVPVHKFALRPVLELSRFQVIGASSRACAPRSDGESGAFANRLVVIFGSNEGSIPEGLGHHKFEEKDLWRSADRAWTRSAHELAGTPRSGSHYRDRYGRAGRTSGRPSNREKHGPEGSARDAHRSQCVQESGLTKRRTRKPNQNRTKDHTGT